MAKAKREVDVLEVEAEEIPVEVALQQAIDHEVKKFDPFEGRMNELMEKYSGIKINGISDKEGIEKNRLAIAELRTIRVNTEKERKQIKAPFLKAAADIEEKAQWIISGVAAIEEPLKAQKKEIQDEIERLDREELDRIVKRKEVRTVQLLEMGATFTGVNYVLGEVSYSLDTIGAADGDVYDSKILPRYREVFEQNELVRLKEEQDKKIENDRIAKEKKDFEDQQAEFRKQQQKLKEDQDKLDKEKKDKEDADEKKRNDEIATRAKERGKQLENIGMVFNFSSQAFQSSGQRVSIDQSILVSLNEIEWDAFIEEQKPVIEKAKKDLQDALDATEKKRRDDATNKALEAQKEYDRIADLKRQQQIEEGNDKNKYAETIQYLKATPIYEMRSGQYRARMRIINDFLADLK